MRAGRHGGCREIVRRGRPATSRRSVADYWMPAAVQTAAPTAAHRSDALTNWSLITVDSMFAVFTHIGVSSEAGSVIVASFGSVVVPFIRLAGGGWGGRGGGGAATARR